MASDDRQPFISVDFGGGVVVAIFLGIADMNWGLRTILALVGIALIGHLAWRLRRPVLVRGLTALVGVAFFAAVTWGPIWRDFHDKHPDAMPAASATLNDWAEHAADMRPEPALPLAILGLVIIGWGWRPVWAFRRRTVSAWRHALNQRVWISKDAAIDLVRRSEWANTRQKQDEPPRALFGAPGLGSIFGQIDPKAEARVSMFIRWCELALESFGRIKFDAVRKNETAQQEYDQDILKDWLAEKYEHDVLDRFGPI